MTREELLQIAKPILFSTPMVLAIKEDRKTQTRRVKKGDKSKYKVGDILYVRETWQYIEGASGCGYAYMAGGGVHNDIGEWRPSIHMPKIAARIFLRVTDVRCERLKDITLSEIEKEGLYCDPPYTKDHFAYGPGMSIHWIKLWDSCYAAPRPVKEHGIITHYESYPWDDIHETREIKGLPWLVCGNPWVWVYGFELVYKEDM